MGLSFQIKQRFWKILSREQIRTRRVPVILKRSAFMFLSCVAVPVAHLLLPEEGCMGLWPPGSADGE